MNHPIENLWREVGLPEYFLGNSGTNDRLYALYDAIRLKKQADRIEALEVIRDIDEYERMNKRIEALEAALRFMLTDPPAALGQPDTDAEIIRHYREVARAALDKDAEK